MKVEQKDKGFQPITLTIESQEELNLLSDLFSLVSDVFEDDFLGALTTEVAHTLVELGANGNFTYIDGLYMDVILK